MSDGLVVESIGGMCPTQAKGTMNGNPFYFRARHGVWALTVVRPGKDAVCPDSKDDVLLYEEGDDLTHGWMEKSKVMAILQKAILVLEVQS